MWPFPPPRTRSDGPDHRASWSTMFPDLPLSKTPNTPWSGNMFAAERRTSAADPGELDESRPFPIADLPATWMEDGKQD